MMVAQLTIGRKTYEIAWEEANNILKETEPLKEKLLQLVDKDAAAYSLVAGAMKLPKNTVQEQEERNKKLEEALKVAAQVPAETLLASAKVFRLAKKMREIGNKNALSDAETAIYLAQASVLGSWSNVHVNLNSIRDSDFVKNETSKLQPVVEEISRE
jgi:methenyltetrahydrofolate cyclohydrolase